LVPGDGRKKVFDKWTDDIRRYDRHETIVRVCAYWAMIEKTLQDSHSKTGTPIAFVSYEKLLAGGRRSFQNALKSLGMSVACSRFRDLDVPSPVTTADRRHVSARARCDSWKEELTRSEIKSIEGIVSRFGMSSRCSNFDA
jgi:hypothetical protein